MKIYDAIVMGASAGGLHALTFLLSKLPQDFPLPLIVVQHRSKDQKDLLEEVLQHKCKIRIKQADEKEKIQASTVYIAPPDYHLLIEDDLTFSLAADMYVRHSRPSINVLFESAAQAYKHRLLGIILTGASDDGADGMAAIHANGGYTIAQSPDEAQYDVMPKAAIQTKKINKILTLAEIRKFLMSLEE